MKKQLKFLTLALATLCVANGADAPTKPQTLDSIEEQRKPVIEASKDFATIQSEHEKALLKECGESFDKAFKSARNAGLGLLLKAGATKTAHAARNGYNYVMHDENKKRARHCFNVVSFYACDLWNSVRESVPAVVLAGAAALAVDSVTTELVVQSELLAFSIGAFACYASSFLPKTSKAAAKPIDNSEREKLQAELVKRQKLLQILQCMQGMNAADEESSDDSEDDGDNSGKKIATEILKDAAEKQTQGATFGEKVATIAVGEPNPNTPNALQCLEGLLKDGEAEKKDAKSEVTKQKHDAAMAAIQNTRRETAPSDDNCQPDGKKEVVVEKAKEEVVVDATDGNIQKAAAEIVAAAGAGAETEENK